jgi:hypothetical protein
MSLRTPTPRHRISSYREVGKCATSPTVNETRRVSNRSRGDFDEVRRQVHALNDVAATRELNGVPAGAAAGIQHLGARADSVGPV